MSIESHAVPLSDCRVPPGWARGRVAREGYQRGFGIQFGGLASVIDQAPLFQKAMTAARELTVVDPLRIKNLYLLLTTFLPRLGSQDVIEFGVYRGGTTIFMATILKEIAPSARIFALDTFEGMPQTDDIDMHVRGDFADANIQLFKEAIKRHELRNIHIAKGLFQETFPHVAQRNPKFGLAHIDCDIYGAVKYCEQSVWPHMVQGGYVVFDDATVPSCLGATQAVEELIMARGISCEQIWPHFVFRANP